MLTSCTISWGGQFFAQFGRGVGVRPEEQQRGRRLAVQVEVETQQQQGEYQGCRGRQLQQLLEITGRWQFEGVDQQVGGVQQVERQQPQEGQVVGLRDAAVEEFAVVVEVHRAVTAPPAVVAPLQHQAVAQHAVDERVGRVFLLVGLAREQGVEGVRAQDGRHFVEDEGQTHVVVQQEGQGEPVQLLPSQLRLGFVGVVLDEEEREGGELFEGGTAQSAQSAHQQNRLNITHRCSESSMQSGRRDILLRPIWCYYSYSVWLNPAPFLAFIRSSTDLIHPSTPRQWTTQLAIRDSPPRMRAALRRKAKVRQVRCRSVQKKPIF